jgi:hypothetical protein
MSGKISAPMRSGSAVGDAASASIEAARRKLGGRLSEESSRAPGSLVRGTLRDGAHRTGVILWASTAHSDVWFDDGIARRVRSQVLATYHGPTPAELGRIHAEVRIFALLDEGDRVRWDRSGALVDGCIVEKCRYGAIVVTREGRLVAVGFRRLWPAEIRARA